MTSRTKLIEKIQKIGLALGSLTFGGALLLAYYSGPAFWLEAIVGGLALATAVYWASRLLGWIMTRFAQDQDRGT